MTHTPQPLLSERAQGQNNERSLSRNVTSDIAAVILRLKLHTVDVVSLDESAAPLSHHNAVRVAVANEVVSQNGVAPSTDVHATPLVLFDDIVCNKRVSFFFSHCHAGFKKEK